MPEDHSEHAASEPEPPLSQVLERLESAVEGPEVSVGTIVEKLGRRSFPALMLVPALIAVSPASGIPGLTSGVGVMVFMAAAQMLVGRECLWLPGALARRRISSVRFCQAIRWLRRPVRWLERWIRPRMSWIVVRPLVALPLAAMLLISGVMPLLELIPTSGSIAAALLSCVALGLLTRDGLVVTAGLVLMLAGPLALWWFWP